MAQLDYGPPISAGRRRLRRGLIALLLLSAMLACATWAVRFVQQIVRVQQQKKLMNFSLPPNTVVVSSDLIGEHGLLSRPGYQLQSPGVFAPATATSLIALNPTAQPRWGQVGSTVFLHRLRAAGQSWRLLSVALQRSVAFDPDNGQSMWLEPVVQIPATLSLGSRLETLSEYGRAALKIPTTAPFRLYAGQPDPNDESHFTICYEHSGMKDAIDGFILSNDSVKLELHRTQKK